MEKWGWLVDVFTFIGMIVCILIALIAIVWITCFAVKLLVKTFNVRVGKSYDLMSEDISKKAEARRERNEIKRKANLEKKNELLNLKLESKQKIHEIKKQKLAEKLKEKEDKVKNKLFGDYGEINYSKAEEPKIEEIEDGQNIVEKKPKAEKTKATKSIKK